MRRRRRLNGPHFSESGDRPSSTVALPPSSRSTPAPTRSSRRHKRAAPGEMEYVDAIDDDDLIAGDDKYQPLAHMINENNSSVQRQRMLDVLMEHMSAERIRSEMRRSMSHETPMADSMEPPAVFNRRRRLFDRYSLGDIPPTGIPLGRREGPLPHDGL